VGVGTSGDLSSASRRGGRSSVAAALLAVLVTAAGCSSNASKPARESRPDPAARALCRAPTTAAWKRSLARGVVALSRRASVIPWGPAGDGRTFFASLYSKSYAGVVRVDAETSRFTPIKRFADRRDDQAVGTFDGRWLVWDEYHSLTTSDDFTTWAWDSRTRQLRQIGAAKRSPSGAFWPSSWRQPDARGGFATWTQGSGLGGVSAVHVYDLAKGTDRVVREGHPEGSFLVAGGLVIWPESRRPRALTGMHAAEAATRHAAQVPPGLRELRGISALVTDGRAIAYPNADFTSLWWSPSLATAPRRLFATGNPGIHVDNSVQVSGRWVAFGVAPATYLVDTVKRRYVKISAGGWTRLDARTLILVKPSAAKAIHPISDVVFRPLTSLPALPSCHA
jgi:hypothetical protein